MCYAIPAKIISINKDQQKAVIDYFGEKRTVLFDLDDCKTGDYIYAQGGIAVRKVLKKEALEILKVWQDIFFDLKKTDDTLAQIDTTKLPDNALKILQQVNLRKTLSKKELLAIFDINNPEQLKVIYELANNVRAKEHGNASCVHGIIEFSNYCRNNCHYCGIRNAKNLHRYRMEENEIVEIAKEASEKFGFKAMVLQSGEDSYYDEKKLLSITKAVRSLGVLVFLSVGVRSKETYKKLYNAGARATLLRFETSNRELFNKIRPNTDFDERINLIKDLKELGYILATGFMIGLPGETKEDLINNILLTKALDPEMYSFGPFLPTKNTPLEDAKLPSLDDALKTIALTRFVAPSSNILVTTALETLNKSGRRQGLLAGANSMMLNLTPKRYKKLYNIYDNKAGSKIDLQESIDKTVKLLFELGRAPTDIQINKKRL